MSLFEGLKLYGKQILQKSSFAKCYFLILSSLLCSCDTLDKIKAQLPKLKKELDETTKFQAIYKYAFQFAKEGEQKCIGMQILPSPQN